MSKEYNTIHDKQDNFSNALPVCLIIIVALPDPFDSCHTSASSVQLSHDVSS